MTTRPIKPHAAYRQIQPVRHEPLEVHNLLWNRAPATPPVRSSYVAPDANQYHILFTGLVLGIFSIAASIFPVCGLPMALAGLVLSLLGRRIGAFQKLASWSLLLAIIGCTLSLLNIGVMLGIYVLTYL
ncbi:hypothetical protein EI42_00643 [Thermosporothrix hazakensis]|jgi:hypothetical protein|uniref:DUF4190 domain-containing protein n=2 Tax=Thermosporothrix TaxID=768650 RepID=A0A326UR37_THEHA|nr:hypothetical protein [Thermosporothrix hazakensis]PZW36469.1 hypothetical protein EI42_00643 [Thermosporothrix hazakensis]BBH88938.1 hypothetical protein KTC_36890 [Thermosporothrix sp. COM3]GCE47124.1 hypothetical protein KTH_19930 [Thermosporothrix hazakensis]